MCVVAIAWLAHPKWQLVVAGNRDEYHARASAPLDRWDDLPGIIAGRDLVSGGSWMGVSDAGRFAVVTNIRNADGPDPSKLSRGALIADWLSKEQLPEAPDRFNPFNLIVTGSSDAVYIANRPQPVQEPLAPGIHGLSNAIQAEHWPRKDRLQSLLSAWLESGSENPDYLFDALRDESSNDSDCIPMFIRSPSYGTRCSTVILVDASGRGRVVERSFDASGEPLGERGVDFAWDFDR